MRKAFEHTGAYDTAIANTLAGIALAGGAFERRPATRRWRNRLTLSFEKIRDLRYGENPHQPAAWYVDALGYVAGRRARRGQHPPGQGAVLHQPARPRCGGTDRPRVHGAGGGGDQAHQPVRRGDRRVAPPTRTSGRARPIPLRRSAASSPLNRPIDRAAAEAIASTFIEAVIAPGVELDARDGARTQAEHARGGGRPRPRADAAERGSPVRCLGALLVQDRGSGHRGPPSLERGRGVRGHHGRDAARSRAPRNGRRCASPGASAPT